MRVQFVLLLFLLFSSCLSVKLKIQQKNSTQTSEKIQQANDEVDETKKQDVIETIETISETSEEEEEEETLPSIDSSIETCIDYLQDIFTKQSLEEPSTSIWQFIEDYCMQLELDIPNAVKPSACFYSGNFLIRYLQPHKDNQTILNTFVNSFCQNYQVDLPLRTTFVSNLKDILYESVSEFNSECKKYILNTPGLNVWFSPIDPLASISQNEICDMHYKLFYSLELKGINSLAEYVSYSYLTTLDLYENALEQENYESCINSKVIKNPFQYCSDYLDDNEYFGLWEQTQKNQVCDKANGAVRSSCGGYNSCDACSILMAEVTQYYISTINDEYSELFEQYEEELFDILEAENKRVMHQIQEGQ